MSFTQYSEELLSCLRSEPKNGVVALRDKLAELKDNKSLFPGFYQRLPDIMVTLFGQGRSTCWFTFYPDFVASMLAPPSGVLFYAMMTSSSSGGVEYPVPLEQLPRPSAYVLRMGRPTGSPVFDLSRLQLATNTVQLPFYDFFFFHIALFALRSPDTVCILSPPFFLFSSRFSWPV